MIRCSKFCSGIADFIMLRAVFVAQKTPEILQVKLRNFLATFHKNSIISDILITIDEDIFRS
jgi:hypothetical protein